ncbi:hypothetical protein KKHLCK_15320 [Candidatus Electrothrix laxa]
MPKISVVIPCYNHGHYIDRAVNSILNQTVDDIEIIVVNDGSTDPFTADKLKKYDKPKTRVLHTVNQGPSAARNFGITQAVGKYILVLDADDYYLPTFLEKGSAVLDQHSNVGIVACGIQHFGLDSGRKMPLGGDVRTFLAPSGLTGSALLRKVCWEQTGGYDETMKTTGYEDWNFWLDVTKREWAVHIIKEYLFYYHWKDESRRTKLNNQRAVSLGQVIRNHRDVFAQYVDLVVLNKDKDVMAMKEQRDILSSSLEYRLGHFLLLPLRFFQRIFSGKLNQQ